MGRPPKNKVKNVEVTTLICNCGNTDEKDFYKSNSIFHSGTGKIPYCKQCIDKLYNYYVKKYKHENCTFPEKRAIKRLCMAFDLFYRDDVFDTAVKQLERMPNMTLITSYIKASRLSQYKNKSYDTTMDADDANRDGVTESYVNFNNDRKVSEKTVKFFGTGFSDDDYLYLQEQYDDWTTRHECETKAQEEVFKRICFKQLEILKATRKGENTKDLDATFQNYLETAKLKPKQNNSETTSDVQTFGTLIEKWETTRPIPEIDEDLRDVDKIGLYLDIFFKGHLAKMMGLKNGLSNLYTKFMKKYTVEKPEYKDDEDGEALFDAIFGNVSLEDV